MRFTATVELHGKSATGIVVPPEVVETLGAGKRPAVTVALGGHTYRSTIASMGGRFLLPLSAENRTAAGVAAGDRVDVDVEVDTAPRTVEVPADLAAALDADPEVRRRFDALPFTSRKEHARSVQDAKAEATRLRRIGKVLAALSEG
jgi:hypothetical protein